MEFLCFSHIMSIGRIRVDDEERHCVLFLERGGRGDSTMVNAIMALTRCNDRGFGEGGG